MVGDMPPEPSRDDSSTGTSFHSPQLKFLYEPLDIQIRNPGIQVLRYFPGKPSVRTKKGIL